jgi:hypothetical protein
MPELVGMLMGSATRASLVDALITLPAAFVLGQLLSWVYEATYQGLSYSRKFADTLTLLTCICSAFVLVARQSLLAGIGLMAVISIVRFRANVKAPNDLVFIMASATFGLGCGVGAIGLSVIGFAGFSIFALLLSTDSMGSRRRFDGVLRLRAKVKDHDAHALEAILERHCLRSTLLASAEIGQGDFVEHSYQVKFHKPDEKHALLQELRGTGQLQDVRLLMQEVNLEY